MEKESEEDNGGIPVRKHMDVSEHSGAIDGTLYEQEIVKKRSDDSILIWIGDQYCASQGFEVGTFQTSLLCTPMNRQLGKETDFALGYVSDVIDIIHTLMFQVLEVICPDEQIRDNLVSVLANEPSKRYREAIEQAQLVLDVERTNIMTLNDKFDERLEKLKNKKYIALFDLIYEMYKLTFYQPPGEAKAPMSNIERTVRYIHDILVAYCEVASKRFVDNICMQATGYCLLTGPRKPLGLFSPQFVANLTEDQLSEIAGENAALSRKRAQLEKGIQDLETGRTIMM
ncbi:Dynamin [Penicillium cf. griseofulvum]|nr:Dynamin [Penicillium cf. griseofulvum]